MHCASALCIGGLAGIWAGCVLRIAYLYCVLESFGTGCVLRIAHPYCVSEVGEVLRGGAYCVLRIRIAYWRALGWVVYCVLRIRIVYRRYAWDGLRIAYCVSVLHIRGLGVNAYCVLRICIVYCVSVLRIGGLGGDAYCVLCICIAYCVLGCCST